MTTASAPTTQATSDGEVAATPATRGMLATAGLLLASYLYGSFPLVYLLGRRASVDLRSVGSGNVGGSNLWAAAGTARGVVGWLFDASKGLVPVVVGRRFGYSEELAQLAGVCGVAGQCWPAFLRFNGGRGISAFVGAGYALNRAAWTLSLLPIIGGALWRAVPLLRGRGQATDTLRATRSKAVPLGCALGIMAYPVAYAATTRTRTGMGRATDALRAPALLASALLLRRLTAPLPDDETRGPRVEPRAFIYRLLYDRNTSE